MHMVCVYIDTCLAIPASATFLKNPFSHCERSPSNVFEIEIHSKFGVGFFVSHNKIPNSIRNKEYFVLENEKSNIFATNLIF